MTTNSDRGSAKIYEFPARGRFAASGHRNDRESAANSGEPRIANVSFGDAWYHEEAIREAAQSRKN
jgi:uncharacterized protein DUF2735